MLWCLKLVHASAPVFFSSFSPRTSDPWNAVPTISGCSRFFFFLFFPPKEITRNLCPKQFRFKCICTRDIPRHLLYPRHFLGRKELPSLSRETISLSPSNLIAPLANEPSFQPVPGWIPPSLTGGKLFQLSAQFKRTRETLNFRHFFGKLILVISQIYLV